MSAPAATSTEAPSAEIKTAKRRRVRSGVSLFARGEPGVWLTGGALTLCMGMILGLLFLVLILGLQTFWPTEIVRFKLLDGTVLMGEVTRDETYNFNSEMLSSLSEKIAEGAEKKLDGKEETAAHRRLVRTGNYEIDNEHFRWVSDFEIAPGGESTPKWAVIFERVEWGRFYGIPEKFVLRHEREPSQEEESLAKAVQFLDTASFRLKPEDQEIIKPKLAEVKPDIDKVKDDLKRIRQRSVAEFTKKYASVPGPTLQVKTDDGKTVALAEADPNAVIVDEIQEVTAGSEKAWGRFQDLHDKVRDNYHEMRRLEKHEIGRVNRVLEHSRLNLRSAEIDNNVFVIDTLNEWKQHRRRIAALQEEKRTNHQRVEEIRKRYGSDFPLVSVADELANGLDKQIDEQIKAPAQAIENLKMQVAKMPQSVQDAADEFLLVNSESEKEILEIQSEISHLKTENARYEIHLDTATSDKKMITLDQVVRGYLANQQTTSGKLGIYFSRWREFLMDDPREANSEGGVFPAVWGTVAMTIIMSFVVVPFGVLAALYLREYARSGPIVSAVRISINNLAGVPSIVFGVFGLGFLCYMVGAYVDGGPKNAYIDTLPPVQWFVGLFILALIAAGAFTLGIMSSSRGGQTLWKQIMGYVSMALWLATTGLIVFLIATSPFFNGFFDASLPNPTFGKGGLMWASLTLALLTLPVVIVATEEALSAVPNSLREGSYACGASKWQTLRRIVLPHAMPGIMTGMILAMARGAGEVAPLMLVGAVKLAPELPVDGIFPFLHGDRSFMHLGFHIYDLGFQSQNSEAAKPMVFTTTLLLIVIIALLNVFAIWLRSRLRRRFAGSQF